MHRARLANPERIQASSTQLDDPLERTAVAALDVLTAAQDTARRHVTASRAARAEVDALLGSVGAEVDVALTQLHRTPGGHPRPTALRRGHHPVRGS